VIEKSSKFQSARVILISFGHLVHDTYTSLLSPLLPLLIEKFALSYSMAGLLGLGATAADLSGLHFSTASF